MEYSGKDSGRTSERIKLTEKKSQGAFESSAKDELKNFFLENKADPERLEQNVQKYDLK